MIRISQNAFQCTSFGPYWIKLTRADAVSHLPVSSLRAQQDASNLCGRNSEHQGAELGFLADAIRKTGRDAVIVDVGTRKPSIVPDISAGEVASYGTAGLLRLSDRGEAVSAMAVAFAHFLTKREDIGGVIGIGGTAIVTAGMQPSVSCRA